MATTVVSDDLSYPPPDTIPPDDNRAAIKKAEKAAETLELQVDEHLESMYNVWEGLAPQRRQELWILELARAVGRKQRDADQLRDSQHALKQENANLKLQIENLNRLQQPREFKIVPPSTIPIAPREMIALYETTVLSGKRLTGFNMINRHEDVNTVVASAIDRWKKVIASSRSASGMSAQRVLDAPTTADKSSSKLGFDLRHTNTPGEGSANPRGEISPKLQNHEQSTGRQNQTASTTTMACLHPNTNGTMTGKEYSQPALVSVEQGGEEDDDMSDQDATDADAVSEADAEMDEVDSHDKSAGQDMTRTPPLEAPATHSTQQLRHQENQGSHTQQPLQNMNSLRSQRTSCFDVSSTRGPAPYPGGGSGAGHTASSGDVPGARRGPGIVNTSFASIQSSQGQVVTLQRHPLMPGNFSRQQTVHPDVSLMQGVRDEPMYLD